jgi:hypothetical protein
MSYDLVPLLDLSWSDAFSAIALVFSGIALIGALRLSKQVERRVDGELGELLPNFALYPAATAVASREGTRILELRIDNYKRRPIRLTRLRIEQPSKLGLVAYHLVGVREMLLGDTNRRHDEVWTSLVVEGTPPRSLEFQFDAAEARRLGEGAFSEAEARHENRSWGRVRAAEGCSRATVSERIVRD